MIHPEEAVRWRKLRREEYPTRTLLVKGLIANNAVAIGLSLGPAQPVAVSRRHCEPSRGRLPHQLLVED